MHGQDHHPRQRRHPRYESTELVVGPYHSQRDRLFRVEIFGDLRLRFEQFVLNSGSQGRLGNIDQQIRHLGLAGQLPQHLLQDQLDLLQLLAISLQIRGSSLFELELLPQIRLGANQRVELLVLRLEVHEPADAANDCKQYERKHRLDSERRGAQVVDVGLAQIVQEAHGVLPPVGASTLSAAP